MNWGTGGGSMGELKRLVELVAIAHLGTRRIIWEVEPPLFAPRLKVGIVHPTFN